MGRSRRGLAALVGILGVLPAVAPAADAETDAPADPTRWIVDRPTFEPIDTTPLTVAGIGDYRGSIELTRDGAKLAVVNHVTVEDYLKGISEVPAAWPLEAQKAQAIAARTYALFEAAKNAPPSNRNTSTTAKTSTTDLCATDSCQVYAGLAKERRPGSEAWLAAVAQTKHQVLLYENRPIAAKYSSSNGGETVGGGQPYLRNGVPDPDDARSPLHRWRASYPVADLARVVNLAAEPATLTRQGEQIVATYVDADGNEIEQRIAVEDFRDRTNNGFAAPPGLPLPVPSRRFDVQVVEGLVHIDGRGWGHGIGLSQYGSLGKALRGMKAPDILAAYYGGLKPTTLPAERIPPKLRIGLASDRNEATVANLTGRFRILDGSGRVLAHSASGSWRATAAADGRIQLIPPPDQEGLPAASIASIDPPQPVAGKPINVSVHLDGPGALTSIDLTRPDGTTQAVDPQRLRHPGPVLVRLTSGAKAGTYRLALERDAGNGRVATTTLDIGVAPSGAAAATSTTTDGDVPGDRASIDETTLDLAFAGAESLERAPIPTRALQATATFMLLAVVVLGAFWVGRRPGSQLH